MVGSTVWLLITALHPKPEALWEVVAGTHKIQYMMGISDFWRYETCGPRTPQAEPVGNKCSGVLKLRHGYASTRKTLAEVVSTFERPLSAFIPVGANVLCK